MSGDFAGFLFRVECEMFEIASGLDAIAFN